MASQDPKKIVHSDHHRSGDSFDFNDGVRLAAFFGDVLDVSLKNVVAIEFDQNLHRVRHVNITDFEMYPTVPKLHPVLDVFE